MLTNGKVTGDKVGPHGDLLDEVAVPGAATRLVAARCRYLIPCARFKRKMQRELDDSGDCYLDLRDSDD